MLNLSGINSITKPFVIFAMREKATLEQTKKSFSKPFEHFEFKRNSK
jgi:hypothetical protein